MTDINVNEKESILKLSEFVENFTDMSSSSDQTEGASEYYNRGVPETKYTYNTKPPPPPKNECDHTCNNECHKECPKKCKIPEINIRIPPPKPCFTPPPQKIYDENPHCKTPQPSFTNFREICHSCDITQNKDIDKSVCFQNVFQILILLNIILIRLFILQVKEGLDLFF
jgi:hypothetical protein